MIEYINSLTPQEAEELKKTIRDLMRQSCIIETKYDTERDCLKDNPRYRICMRHREFLTDYFDVMGCTLVYDPQDHFFRLTGDGVGTEKFSEPTTLFILLMKLIYKEKIMGEGLRATVTNLEEIRRHGMDTGLLTRKLTDREVYDAVSVMKNHQMIEIPCAIGDLEDDTPIYMYNMINVFCSGFVITQLYQKYRSEPSVEEDQEVLELGTGIAGGQAMEPEAEEMGPEAQETEPEAQETELEAQEPEPEARETEPEAQEPEPEAQAKEPEKRQETAEEGAAGHETV